MVSNKLVFFRSSLVLLLCIFCMQSIAINKDSTYKDSIKNVYHSITDVDQKYEMYKFLSKDLKKDAKFQDSLNKDFMQVCKRERWNYLPSVHNNIGYAFSRKHEYDSALHYYNLALDAYHVADDSVATIQVYARMAKAYAKQSNYSLGLIYQKKAIDLAEYKK